MNETFACILPVVLPEKCTPRSKDNSNGTATAILKNENPNAHVNYSKERKFPDSRQMANNSILYLTTILVYSCITEAPSSGITSTAY